MTWGWDVLYQTEQGAGWERATRLALSTADGFLFDSDAVRNRSREFADIPDSRIVQFPWGIRKGSFTATGARPSEEQLTKEPGTCLFICTRSWEPIYDVHVLLEAFRRAHRVDSSLRLLLVGNGSGKGQIVRFIGEHGLDRAISIPGYVRREEMPKWFRAADAYVSCAKTDSTSISLLEAMATGLPVIVTDISSNREWVRDGENGWLARAGSAEEFAQQLLHAARIGPEQRALISLRNQRLVEERADWDRNFPSLIEMYKQLVVPRVTP
jgi:glycosyltransferase involved in cell wall biosynthesis